MYGEKTHNVGIEYFTKKINQNNSNNQRAICL